MSRQATMDAAALTYVGAVFKAFKNERVKLKEFEKTVDDIRTRRVDVGAGYAKIKELLKDHPNLLVRLNDFLPADAKLDFPVLTICYSYLDAVDEAFKDEPSKFLEFCLITKNDTDDEATSFARLKGLMKDHPHLLFGLNAFFPPKSKTNIASDVRTHRQAEVHCYPKLKELMKVTPNLDLGLNTFQANRTMALEAKIPTVSDATDILKRIREAFHRHEPAEYEEVKKLLEDISRDQSSLSSIQQIYPRAHNLVARVKERFQGGHNHVYKSFLQIVMRMLREGNMSSDKVYHEIITLLQDHQDLVREFSEFFNQ